jgi:hypothetical protein
MFLKVLSLSICCLVYCSIWIIIIIIIIIIIVYYYSI